MFFYNLLLLAQFIACLIGEVGKYFRCDLSINLDKHVLLSDYQRNDFYREIATTFSAAIIRSAVNKRKQYNTTVDDVSRTKSL